MSATDRLLAIPSLKHVSLSPDGTTVLATVGVVAAGADTEAYELRQISTIDGTSHAPLGTEPGDRFGVWSADGTSFAMLTDRGGSTQVAVVRPENTEPENAEPLIVSALPAGAGGPACWSPDGTMLVVIAPARLDQVDRSKPYRITRATPRFDGIGWLDDAPQLWLIDLRPGLDPADRQRLLTDDGWRWDVAGWSPDGTTILATANHAPDGVGRATEVRIVAVDGTWRVADVPRSENASACWGSDGSVVAVPARIVGDGTGKKKDIWVERLGGAPECRTASFALGVGGAVYGDHAGWLSDANWMAPVPGSSDILVRFADGGRHGIVRVSTEGPESVLPVAAGDRCLNPVAIAGDIALVVTETATAPPELAVLTLTSGQLRTITSFASDAVAPVDVRRFTANAGAGHTTGPDIEAWFMAPLGAATPLPTVLLVHGGPECGFGEAFSVDAHVLCDAGFGVLYCNPRGSTGYGNEFTAAGIGNWGGPPVDDVVAVIELAVGMKLADPERLGISGNSFGGWMTSWLCCTTDRFRAGVAENPVTDLLSMSYTSDIGPEFMALQMGGDVQTEIERYLRWSPLLQAHRCRTPLLFVSGDQDDRCPPTQAKELAAALHRHGVPTEVLVLPGAAHEGSSFGPVAGRHAQNDALVEWMQRWLCH